MTAGTITQLIEEDAVQQFKFENAIVQVLKDENQLQSKSDAQQRSLLFKREADPQSVMRTLDHIIKAIDRSARNYQNQF